MPRKRCGFIFVFVLIGFFISAQDVTLWRGPNGNGVYTESGLLKEWHADGPEIIWYFEGLGDGHSSPAIAHNRIYLSGMNDNKGYIYALNFDGKLEWKAAYGEEFTESYPGARSTPVIAGDLLYIYSGHGVLTCMDANTGNIKWKKNAFKDFDGKNITWGVTETVLIDGDLLFLTPGGKKNNVVALNRITGDMVWTSPGKGDQSAYCTPIIVDLPARKLLVTHTGDNILGLDAKDGKLLWSYPHTNRYQVHANTPIYHNGELFCFSGYGQGSVKLTLNEDGSKVTPAWKSKHLDSRIGGMVLVNGYLYGSGDTNRQWRCVDWNTGKETYASTDIAKGVVIAADGMLYCYSERGELALVRATPDGFNINGLAKVKLGTSQHWSHPVINNGRLYLRHGDVLIAYKVK